MMDNEFVDEDVELELSTEGKALPDKNDLIYLCDADTLLFGVCLNLEIVDEVMPRDFYNEEEWKEIVGSKYFNLIDLTIGRLNLDEAKALFYERLQEHLDATGCTKYELHFTTGRNNFRYQLFEEYKANRTRDITKRPPAMLSEMKHLLTDTDEEAYLWETIEADDAVCAKYDPEIHILGAVDKDVIKNLVGKHYNYYRSVQYGIEPKFVETDKLLAIQQPYIQTLTGDSSDGIPGLNRIGPKTAEKLLGDEDDINKLWEIVVATYEKKGKTRNDAILTMRLVSMHQYYPKTDEVILFGTVHLAALNTHRLNVAKLGYLEQVLDYAELAHRRYNGVEAINDPEAKLIVINGVLGYEEPAKGLLTMMNNFNTFYFINDVNHVRFSQDNISIVSQFKDAHSLFYSLSELHILQEFRQQEKTFDYVYWGHFKEERRERYLQYIPNNRGTLIIGNIEEWGGTHGNCSFMPYTRDLEELYDLIALGAKTTLIGDEFHDGNNVASRYFEAIRCGVTVEIDERLIDAFTHVDTQPSLMSMGHKLQGILNG